jgi:hypothetical protein
MPLAPKGGFMKKAEPAHARGDERRTECRREDLGKGVRGKYSAADQKGSNLVPLAPELAKAFPTSDAVNEAAGLASARGEDE